MCNFFNGETMTIGFFLMKTTADKVKKKKARGQVFKGTGVLLGERRYCALKSAVRGKEDTYPNLWTQ